MSTMPIQKPGKSVQVVGTPDDFLAAVRKRLGKLSWDLAANAENSVVDNGRFFGEGDDSLSRSWSALEEDGFLWLNPPFSNIGPWAEKCYLESLRGVRIAFLVPLSTANWAVDYVHGKAVVLGLCPRLTFKGHTAAYPKDMMLAVYGSGQGPSFRTWRWKQ